MNGERIRLVGLAGSLRRASASKAILRTLVAEMPDGVEMDIFDLVDVPLYNLDLDDVPPAAVVALRNAVSRAHGLVVVSPEHNHGMSAVIKNAVDWISRPSYASILADRPVAVFTTSESPSGGVRAQSDLHKMFHSCLASVAPGREVAIGHTEKSIVDGRLIDPAYRRRAMTLIDSLIAEIRRARPGHWKDADCGTKPA